MTQSLVMSRTEIPPLQIHSDAYIIQAQSDVGAVRKENQDFFGFRKNDHCAFLIVLDGMGGHSGGFEASRIACASMLKYFDDTITTSPNEPEIFLQEAINAAHEDIRIFAQENPQMEGMGTTVVCALIFDKKCWIAHVGDSRAYIMRNNQLFQLTIDHTCVNQLALSGEISIEKMKNHPMNHILDRSMGSEEFLEIEVYPSPIALMKGDLIILSSDGFLQYVEDNDFLTLFSTAQKELKLQNCIDIALKRGGSDNITVATLEFLLPNEESTQLEDIREGFYERVEKAQEEFLRQLELQEPESVFRVKKLSNSSSLRVEYMKDGEYELPPPPEKVSPIMYVLLAILLLGTGMILGAVL